jgi:hypothetical protein
VPDTRPLRAYLQLQTALDTDVLTALRASANNLDTELRRLENKVGVGAAVRREQLLHTQVAINKQMASLWTKVGELTKAADLEAAAAGAQSILDGSESTIASLFSEAERETMVRSARLSAQRGLDTALERVSGTSRIPLAESVYHNTALTSGKIEEIVNNAITRGASAADLARDVRQYINPNTPGGVRYAAMRLGRTELNNAFHASQVRQAQKSPFISGLKWNLSGSHPRPDECNDYAGHNDDGIFSPTEVPAKPHPNCLCYTTPETVSEDAFVQAYKRGDYDGFLEESGLPPAPETEKIIPPGPVTPAPSIPTPKPTVSAQTRAATIEDFPRMEPQAYREAVPVVNPGTGTEFRNNCHFVAPSMELRARGFDIVARQTFKATGRIDRSIENDWLDPLTGKPRRFRNMLQPPAKDARGMNIGPVEKKAHYLNQFDQIKIADWPPNSRGFVVVEWDGGSAHIFNMYRDEHGAFKFVDGQVNKQEASNYFSKVKSVQIMRVDDLEPVAERLAKVATPELEPVNVLTRRKVLEDFVEQYTADAGLAPTRDYNFYRDEITRFRDEIGKLPKPGSAAETKAAAEAAKKAADAAAKVAERERLRAERAAEEAAQIAKFKKIAEEEQRVKAEAAAKVKVRTYVKAPIDSAGPWLADAPEFVANAKLTPEDRLAKHTVRGKEDPLLAQILKKQGFDGLPAKVTQEQADKLIQEGGLELFRGLASTADRTAEQMIEAFTNGDLYAGRGMFGNGTYGSTLKNYAEGYANNGEFGGKTLRMVLDKDARVVTLEELTRLVDALPPIASNTTDPYYILLKDPGRYAAMLGIDAVTIADGAETLILNRTALHIVEV